VPSFECYCDVCERVFYSDNEHDSCCKVCKHITATQFVMKESKNIERIIKNAKKWDG
jgi:hypothetical protein